MYFLNRCTGLLMNKHPLKSADFKSRAALIHFLRRLWWVIPANSGRGSRSPRNKQMKQWVCGPLLLGGSSALSHFWGEGRAVRKEGERVCVEFPSLENQRSIWIIASKVQGYRQVLPPREAHQWKALWRNPQVLGLGPRERFQGMIQPWHFT